jgi:hypothetical protein
VTLLARSGAVEGGGAAALRAGVFSVRRGRAGVAGRRDEGFVITTPEKEYTTDLTLYR